MMIQKDNSMKIMNVKKQFFLVFTALFGQIVLAVDIELDCLHH